MKLAIIGSGPLAIFSAQHFDQIGAEVVLFQKSPLGGNIRFLIEHFPELEISYNNQNLKIKNFWEQQLVPAIQYLEERNLTKAGEVLRVHKRFLHKEEMIYGKTRLHDLFRVIYSVNPKESILKQLTENPEMFSQLGEHVVNSLHMPVESFEDFDIVIDARGLGRESMPMGAANASALNEKNLKGSAALYYQKEIFSCSLTDKKNLVVIGHTEASALTMLKCKEWLFSKPEHSLNWVTHLEAKKPFHNDWLTTQLNQLLDESQSHFEKQKEIFEVKIHEWRDLEDYIKAKVPKPVQPEPKIKIFEGYDVTSVDRLLDREGVFATIETPDFREFAPQNDLKTLPAEALFITCGVIENSLFEAGEKADEPGHYILKGDDLNSGLNQIKKIEEGILSFFSRAQ
jgi:hypothetical protein